MKLVSIITPACNAAGILADTIESIRAQSFTDWEMIIIDDNSADGTTALASHYAQMDERVRIIRRAEQGGPATARNQGIAAATGRYLAFIDPGDIWLPEKLALQLAFMQEHHATISCTAFRRSGLEKPGRIRRIPMLRITFDTLIRHDPVALTTVMIDREQSGEIAFDPDQPDHADKVLWLMMTKSGHDIYFFDRDLARIARRGDTAKPWPIRLWHHWRLYRDIAGLPVPDTLIALTTKAARAVRR